jgi:hypothetical protein
MQITGYQASSPCSLRNPIACIHPCEGIGLRALPTNQSYVVMAGAF